MDVSAAHGSATGGEYALIGLGIDVVDVGLSTTAYRIELAVVWKKRRRIGIIITASHNPREWNALKLLNEQG